MPAPLPCAIGIDLGGTNLRAARVRSDGIVEQRWSCAVERDRDAIIGQITALAERLVTPGTVAVGLGVPGRLDAARRRMVSGGYVDLSGLDLVDTLETRFERAAAVDNDVGMALVGEHALGAARSHEDVAMLAIGTGIGGALLSGGRRLHGLGNAGQLGHVRVADGEFPCACGRHGCLEAVAAGPALGRLIEESGFARGTRIEDVFLASARGEPRAGGILRAWGAALRRGIDSIVAVTDPAIVILGGGLGAAAAQAVEAYGPSPSPWFRRPVRPAALGDDAGIIGCALSALERAAVGERSP